MRSNNRRQSKRIIALAAAAALLSPYSRRVARKTMHRALDRAIKVGETVVRGTRNLQEVSKHVTRFGEQD